MKQENTHVQEASWKEYVYFVSTVIPGILGRILVSPNSSFVTSNEKLEYSYGLFLQGTSILLMLLMFRKWASLDTKKAFAGILKLFL